MGNFLLKTELQNTFTFRIIVDFQRRKDQFCNFEKFRKKFLEPDLDPDHHPNLMTTACTMSKVSLNMQ